MGREPGKELVKALEERAEELAGSFQAQNMSNTLWAYATMGRVPGAGLLRRLEERAEAVMETFNPQNVANSLWAASVFAMLAPEESLRLMLLVVDRLVSLSKTSRFSEMHLSQIHQFFLTCSMEEKLRVEPLKDKLRVVEEKVRAEAQDLKELSQSAFVKGNTNISVSQRQVSETLCRMGLLVTDEFRCRTSGYSIDMLVREDIVATHGNKGAGAATMDLNAAEQRSSTGKTWAVEFDGAMHFFADRSPNGGTLLKRRHLELLGYTVVSVPYWEWYALGKTKGVKDTSAQRAREGEEYLRRRLSEPQQQGAEEHEQAAAAGSAPLILSSRKQRASGSEDASDPPGVVIADM
eukprot:Tamp_16597.p1 GENE.Tamp_16597~~Tamp_16597.p1  ORF type:complete len:359 (+),score=84.46 Tamp_16597:27-1079(+)